MTEVKGHKYHYLERRPGSSFKQLFVRGCNIWAEVLFRQTIGEEPRTPEEVAHDFELPLEAVREAIHYCEHNPEVLQEDWEREEASRKAFDRLHPPVLPPDYVPKP